MITLNTNDDFIRSKMKRVYFLDIETALINARVFRTGLQTVSFNQLDGYTRLLTAAWGTMWDLYTKGEEGVKGVSNHTGDTNPYGVAVRQTLEPRRNEK